MVHDAYALIARTIAATFAQSPTSASVDSARSPLSTSCDDERDLRRGLRLASGAAGQQGACDLLTDHTVKCWGENPANDFASGRFPPIDMTLTTATALSMRTDEVACALSTADVASCCGANWSGAVGIGLAGGLDAGATATVGGPVFDNPRSVTGHYVQISAGGSDVLALGTDGHVYGWGVNEFGQTGHPPSTAGDVLCLQPGIDTGTGRPCNGKPTQVVGLP